MQNGVSKIRVLYACTAFSRGSGGEMHPLALARHLDRAKYDFGICVIENARSDLRLAIERCGCPFYDLNVSRRFYNVFNLIRIVYGFYRVFKHTKPHIVQTHALHANLLARPAAKLAGVPIVIATENCAPDIERHVLRRCLNAPLHLLNRLLDVCTHRIVVVSEHLRRWKGAKSAVKIEMIPPPFDVEAFDTAQPSSSAHLVLGDASQPVIGVVGRLSPEKGHRYLIAGMTDILAHVPQARLWIVGDGPLRSKLEAQVRRLNLDERVTFLGYQRDVFAHLARIDILVVPSLSEAFSLVTVEGMAMARPVVGTRVGGIPEIILDGETGLLVPPRDRAALAQACQYLVMHPETGREMGRRGRERVLSHFHPAQFVASHERLYERVVARYLPKTRLDCNLTHMTP